jgi:hypothetical protein
VASFNIKWRLLSALCLILLSVSLFVWGPFQKKRPFLRIPIVFLEDKPCINVNFEGAIYPFHLDSGSSSCFSTHKKEIIEKIKNKEALEPVTWFDVKGNEYLSSSFLMKRVDIETFQVTNATIQEEDPSFTLIGSNLTPSIWDKSKELDAIFGRIGIRTLKSLNYWLLDFSQSSLFAIRDIETIKNIPGFSFDGFTEIHFEENPKHVVISIETDFGVKKLILDTGASHTVITSSEEHSGLEKTKTDRFVIGGHNFGETELYLFSIDKHFACDGFLGRDFLYKHAIYLDFKKNRAFIGP